MKSIAELASELGTLRPGRRSPLDDILSGVREVLDVEIAVVYGVMAQIDGTLRVEPWHQAGGPRQLRARMAGVFSTCEPTPPLLYDPLSPDRAQRNRVIEAKAWFERRRPGAWRSAPVIRDALAPLGLADHLQLRVLICDGSEMLAWFGIITPGPLLATHRQALAALHPVLRRRLAVERRLGGGPATHAALVATLGQLGAPAVLLDARDHIHHANEDARALLARDPAGFADAIAAARARRDHHLRVVLTPVAGSLKAWLAIVGGRERAGHVESALAAAALRWRLTRRQREVLAMVVGGESNAAIAARLAVSVRAVELHVTALLAVAQVDNRVSLVAAVLAR